MKFTEAIIQKVRSLNKKMKILLIDGNDLRAQKAALELEKENLVEIILLVESEKDVKQNGLTFLNMNKNDTLKENFINQYVELRKGKENLEEAKKVMNTRPFFASMLLKNAQVDAVVGGLLYKTADILRPAFKIIGPKPGIKTISSAIIMHKENDAFIFSDISVNIKPNSEQLAQIALNAVNFAKLFNLSDHTAFLSFSTSNSAPSPESDIVREATSIFNEKYDGTKAIGEIQLDAAVDLNVREHKYGKSSFNDRPSVFVFPELNAGNIGYKLLERFANFGAIGPIINGIGLPINDLSRGASVEDIYYTVLISALQASAEVK